MLNIRAHHLLCTSNFVGEGYSDDFSKNMTSVINLLKNNPKVKLKASVDDICKKCPNKFGNFCKDSDKVIDYDKKVLKAIGLNAGEIINWNEAKKLTCDIIFKNDRREEICGDCQWNNLCKEVEKERLK